MKAGSKYLIAGAALLGATSALIGAASAFAQERVAIDLNLYGEIEINRPPSAVWPYIVEVNSWKPERHMVHVSGPKGQIGEVFGIVAASRPDQIWFLAENVELVPNTRRTIKMYNKSLQLTGYTTWKLEGQKRTMLRVEIHGESVIDPEKLKTMTPQQLAEERRNGYESNKKRVDAELLVLKKMLESR